MQALRDELNKLKIPKINMKKYLEDPVMVAKITVETIDNWSWYICQFDGYSYCFGGAIGLFPDLGYYDLQEIMNAAHGMDAYVFVEKVNVRWSELRDSWNANKAKNNPEDKKK